MIAFAAVLLLCQVSIVDRPVLGVVFAFVDGKAIILGAESGYPGESMGLRPGDTLIAVGIESGADRKVFRIHSKESEERHLLDCSNISSGMYETRGGKIVYFEVEGCIKRGFRGYEVRGRESYKFKDAPDAYLDNAK